MLSLGAARTLLVLHAIVAVATVAAATHWVVWLWPFRRGVYTRVRGARRFGVIAMSLYAVAFVGGLVLYPTYKVRVKLEYLTSTPVVEADRALRAQATEDVLARSERRPARTLEGGALARAADGESVRSQKVARWFDTKENWAAVGLVLGLATMAILLAWDPRKDGPGPRAFVLLGALGTAAVLWLSAIVGLITTATRSF